MKTKKVLLIILILWTVVLAGTANEDKNCFVNLMLNAKNQPGFNFGFNINKNFEVLAGLNYSSSLEKQEYGNYDTLEDLYSLGFKYYFSDKNIGPMLPYVGYSKITGTSKSTEDYSNPAYTSIWDETGVISGDKIIFGIQYFVNSEENIAINTEFGYIKKVTSNKYTYKYGLTGTDLAEDEAKSAITYIDTYTAVGVSYYF